MEMKNAKIKLVWTLIESSNSYLTWTDTKIEKEGGKKAESENILIEKKRVFNWTINFIETTFKSVKMVQTDPEGEMPMNGSFKCIKLNEKAGR